MRLGKKKESLLGIVITAVLCLGFLWWWFRPKPQPWQEQGAMQLVERSLQEAPAASRVERQVLDLDLLEIALGLVRERRKDEALSAAQHMTDPVLRFLAGQQLARGWINSDPPDFGEALEFTALASDAARAAEMRTGILGLLAASGFADIAVAEAKTPLQKAVLAARIRDDDNTARSLLAGAAAALPSLPPAEAAAVRLEIARGLSKLSVVDDPAPAMAAIKELPVAQRGPLWADLIGWCQGRKDKEVTVPLVFSQVEDPAVRRRLEIESLLFDIRLCPPEKLISDCRAEVESAATPEAKVRALLTLADAQGNLRDLPGNEAAATETLLTARSQAKTITDPAARCRSLLSIARELPDFLAFDASRGALDEAIAAAHEAKEPAVRVTLLLAASDECFKQADEPRAVQLLEQAVQIHAQSPEAVPPETTAELASAVMRRGDWPRALSLVDCIPEEAARTAALEAAAATAAEDCTSVDPGNPPPRGPGLDEIRRTALTDQVAAANLTEALPEGFERARGWLAMAKATLQPPSSLTDYIMAGDQPPDAELPVDGLPPEAGAEDPVIQEQ